MIRWPAIGVSPSKKPPPVRAGGAEPFGALIMREIAAYQSGPAQWLRNRHTNRQTPRRQPWQKSRH